MKPADLQAASFAAYAPEARALAVAHLELLRQIPLAVLPTFLEQIQSLPNLFPKEQATLTGQIDFLSKASPQARATLLGPFAAIPLSPALQQLDWVNSPGTFLGSLSGYLWQSTQIDAYHRAASALFAALPRPAANNNAPAPLLISVFGRDATRTDYSLFTKLRTRGLYLRSVSPAGAGEALMALLRTRSQLHAAPYAHWYIDGGSPWSFDGAQSSVVACSYPELAPLTDRVLQAMDKAVQQGTGPEVLVQRLSRMRPEELNVADITTDARLAHFYIQLLTQSSGTQVYSTSFVQAAAVALLRRAQPQTLCMRFAPRRKPASLNDMIEQRGVSSEPDANGAMIDADMATYYAWLALCDLPNGERSTLISYVEDRGEAFVISPSVTRGAESATPLTMSQVLALSAA